MSVKFSTGLPNAREGRQHPVGSVRPDWIIRVAQLAEDLGYYSLWPNEFFVTFPDIASRYSDPPNLYETMVTMAYVLATTTRIRVNPGTLVLPLHDPILLSRQIATLDVYSGGRISIGVGLGGGPAGGFRKLRGRIEKPNRGAMMDENLQALRILWTERKASFAGTYTHFEDVETYPKPLQDPVPIYIAGHAEGVYRRVARYGQGWINSSARPDDLRTQVAHLRACAVEAGRGDERIEIARQLVVSVAPTEHEAKAIYAAAIPPPTRPQPDRVPAAGPEKPRHPEEKSLVGTPERLIERLREYVEAGTTEFSIIFCYPDLETGERQLRLFAEKVIPAVA